MTLFDLERDNKLEKTQHKKPLWHMIENNFI